jgi:hypothetical protein
MVKALHTLLNNSLKEVKEKPMAEETDICIIEFEGKQEDWSQFIIKFFQVQVLL